MTFFCLLPSSVTECERELRVHAQCRSVFQAMGYLIPEELFKMELEEGVERVQRALQVFGAFRHTFQLYRDRLSPVGPYSQPGRSVKPWDFPSRIIFQRADRITERLLMIEVE